MNLIEVHGFRALGQNLALKVEKNEVVELTEEGSELLNDICQATKEYSGSNMPMKRVWRSHPGFSELHKNGLFNTSDSRLSDAKIKVYELSGDINLTLNVSQQCNLKCNYCYARHSTDNMKPEIAKRSIDFLFEEFSALKRFSLSFYGGEPLLNFNTIKSAVNYAVERCARANLQRPEFGLTTNGTLMNYDIAEFLGSHSFHITVSVDGDKTAHDLNRKYPDGRGSYADVIKALDILKSTPGVVIGTSSVLGPQSSVIAIYEHLNDAKITDLKIEYAVDFCEGCVYAGMDRNMYLEETKKLAQICLSEILSRQPPKYKIYNNRLLLLWGNATKRTFCPAGCERIAVSPDGNIYPCGPAAGLNQWRIGHIDEGFDKGLEDFTHFNQEDSVRKCKDCWARHLCLGGCPLRRSDDEICEINRETTETAIGMYAAIRRSDPIALTVLVDHNFLDDDVFERII